MTPDDPLIAALAPLTSRVRTDVTAVKRNGKQAWTRERLTADRIARHLNGGPARGVSQIHEGASSTLVGLLDFDSHDGATPWPDMLHAATEVMASIELLGGVPISFRSSGGRGIHLYCLWNEPQDAYSVRMWLSDALKSCGYKSGTKGVQAREVEIFPKQNEVPIGGYGNQAILPLSGASVPLVFEPLLDDWMPGTREDALRLTWGISDPVPLRERPVVPRASYDISYDFEELSRLLLAIPNTGPDELSYDEWRDVVFIIHHETRGEGLQLAHAFSAKSSKYVPAFLDERVWPFVRSDREVVKGIGSLKRIAGSYGWHEPLDDSAFEDISASDDRPPVAAQAWADLTSQTARDATLVADMQLVAKLPDVSRPAVKRRGIPEAHYLTTDQANAQRLKNAFGSLVFVAAGKWHVWDGKRWVGDESDVYRYGCRLSDIVREEAKPFRARAAVAQASGDAPEKKRNDAIADALGKWAVKCEMKGTIEAAIGLARKMLTVEPDVLDRDPWALNCSNGTVDLRTGTLRRHDPADYITRLVPIRYDPGARCDTWDRVIAEIAREDGHGVNERPLVAFLQRWFGYCLTAHTHEQCFVVHWGDGSNGKSTLLDLMAETMGDYAGTAAPGLLVAVKGDRHPTEIAALFGRRMVTAHESGEGVVLREDFIKQATGGDMLTARYMREDFFTFAPTHKIQLLTNHKPQVKGQDEGIWRRVRLVPYLASFGSVEEVSDGRRTHVKDETMPLRLRAELEGILAWRVRGAVEWSHGGLQAPRVVTAASEAYRSEQDRVGQFVAECCEVGKDCEEPLTEGMGGLYPAFQSWCKDGGVYAMSKLRFLDEILRVVPLASAGDRRFTVAVGKQRKVKMVVGIRLLPE